MQQVQHKGEILRQALETLPHVKSVSGMGLMLGVEFDETVKAADVVAKCIEKGVLFLTAKTKLRLLPPLIMSEKQIAEGIKVLKSVLAEM